MRPTATNNPVARCVCLSVTRLYHAKTTSRLEWRHLGAPYEQKEERGQCHPLYRTYSVKYACFCSFAFARWRHSRHNHREITLPIRLVYAGNCLIHDKYSKATHNRQRKCTRPGTLAPPCTDRCRIRRQTRCTWTPAARVTGLCCRHNSVRAAALRADPGTVAVTACTRPRSRLYTCRMREKSERIV